MQGTRSDKPSHVDHGSLPSRELADVLIPRRVRTPFTYRIPGPLSDVVRIGTRVRIPLGTGVAEGVVVGFPSEAPRPARKKQRFTVRDIQGILPAPHERLPVPLVELSRWLAAYYLAPWGQCLRLVLPPLGPLRRGARQRKADQVSTQSSEEQGARDRDATLDRLPSADPHPVTEPISVRWKQLEAALVNQAHGVFLLEGTSSGHLRRLLETIAFTLAQGRTVLLIVPEIVRVAALTKAARARWGPLIAEWHGAVAAPVRTRLWEDILQGKVRVIIGTRSAAFVPLPMLGLIIVDDEGDASLKEEKEPRYHARDVAWERARQETVPLLLLSLHPSLDLLITPAVTRVTAEASSGPSIVKPRVEVVDLGHAAFGSLFTESMAAGLQHALALKLRAVLFLNRKGFAPALQCRDCGKTPQCTECSVALTFFRRERRLACHYCGAAYPLPESCPACNGTHLRPSGFGTEQLEDAVRGRFPEARVLRLDTQTARTSARAREICATVEAGEFDVLIGTQMLFQGLTLPPVVFVGIADADAGLHRPDFHSAERTYNTLIDAVSLIPRGQPDGLVVLQTHLPTHHAIEAVVKGDPALFYDYELELRRSLGYPPFAHVIGLNVTGTSETLVRKAAQQWTESLAAEAARQPELGSALTVLGPIDAPIARARGRHRSQILVKSSRAENMRAAVAASLAALESRVGRSKIKLHVDVDPVEMS